MADRIKNNFVDKTYLGPSTPDSNGTIEDIFNQLDREFNFTLDAAASAENAKCDKYYTIEDDALVKDWSNEVVFCAPPNDTVNKGKFIRKAWEESRKGAIVVLFIPVDTGTNVFLNYLLRGQIRFIHGRLKFYTHGVLRKDVSPKPSMVCVFDKKLRRNMYMVDRTNVWRRLDIEPVLVHTISNVPYIFNDTSEVVDYLDGWYTIKEEDLIEHILSNSTELIGPFKVYTKDVWDGLMSTGYDWTA